MQRPHSPVDEELQNLYNEVWASFSEEPTAPPLDLHNPQNTRVEPTPLPHATAAPPNGSPPYARTIPRMPSNNFREPSPTSPKSGGPRRLPPTPISPATANPLANSMAMPEPEPYPDVSNFSHYYSDSFASSSSGSNDLRKTAAGNAASRRLPMAPGVGNGYPIPPEGARPPVPPKPYDLPLARNMSLVSRDSSILSSATGHSFFGSGSTETATTTPSREPSYRPPGTKAPSIPGHGDYDKFIPYDQQTVSPEYASQYSGSSHQPNRSLSRSSSALSSPSIRAGFGQPSTLSHSQSYNAHSPQASMGTVHVDSPPHRNTSLSSSIGYQRPGGNSLYNESINSGFGNGPSPSLSYQSDPNGQRIGMGLHNDGYDLYDQRRPSLGAPNNSEMLQTLAEGGPNPEEYAPEDEEEYWEDEEEDESRFINYSMISHMAVQLRDKVPRGTHVKGSIPYPRAFTGKDIVSTIQSHIQRELAITHGISTSDRRAALQIARSLQSQLFFYEVEWGSRVLQDGVEDVYMFLGDLEGGSDGIMEPEELPTGVITMMTRCYSPSCADGGSCYAYSCPRKGNSMLGPPPVPTPEASSGSVAWSSTVDPAILKNLPESEVSRQSIIHKMITKEEQYLQDLDTVESTFIKPLRSAVPPVVVGNVDDFIEDVFGNMLDLRECNRNLLEILYVRQREQGPIIQRIGDIFLDAAMEFRLAYPIYISHYPTAEKRLKDELEGNPEFRLFLEQCSRHPSRQGEAIRLDLKHFLNRPSEHLQKYPVLLEAIQHETAEGNPDIDFLTQAIEAIKRLHSDAQLRTFQVAMGKGTPGKWEWHDLVPEDVRNAMPKKDAKRQAIIFELIKGEMAYVKDLENISKMYIVPLRSAEPPIIPRDRLERFIQDVFHNYNELYEHHSRLVDKLQEIQREEHPNIRSISAPLMDAALHFRDSYMEYVPNYPIAAYRIDDEMANNLAFKTFVEQAVRHPDAHRLDMKNFINRPIPRLLRYELLLKGICECSPQEHDDHDTIPPVIDIIKALGKETEPGVFSAKQKVELWRYNSNIVFKPGEAIDMDLLDQNRSLIHSGKLLRQPESGLEWSGWSELFVLLFDNYMVMTKPKERDGITRYNVNRRPIPLDLLTLVNFTDPPTQRSVGLLRGLRGGGGGGERYADGPNSAGPGATPESATDSRSVYPITLHHIGRTGGTIILYAESAQARNDWKLKLEEALGLRKVVQESNKVFEVETLSAETFLIPSPLAATPSPAWNQDSTFTGKVTCSVPFTTPNGRPLVAIGCAEGVWIGYRHDPRSMRRVLHLKLVTQCAMLEEFGIFLVLADKSLFAYHIEALVPSSPQAVHAGQLQVPQKLSGAKDVQFFRVGNLHGRTLVVYMKKKGIESVFRVLEPVDDKINERTRAPVGLGSRFGFRSGKSEWFRAYRDFFLPSESFDVIFLKTRVVVLCAKGFELMDLDNFDSRTLPLIEDPRMPIVKRLESCRPMGMFRSKEDEFLLCYDEFGLYVDRHGDPSRSATAIEWEGTAERIAFHAPYILIFDSRFIEIRHVETGRLAQIISGNDVRCIWDGRGAGTNLSHVKEKEESEIEEAQVHAVMNVADHQSGNYGFTPGVGRAPKVIAQNVVELIPTVPLYVTGATKAPPSALPDNGYLPDKRSYFSPVSPETARSTNTMWR